MRSFILLLLAIIFFGCGGSGESGGGNTPPALVGLELTTNHSYLAPGWQLQGTLTARYDDGTQQNVADAAGWESSDETILISRGNGIFDANATGTVTVTAEYDDLRTTQEIVVSDAAITSITLTPKNAILAKGESLTFQAEGVFEDSNRSITDLVIWSSSNTAVLTVTSSGSVTAHLEGDANLTATYQGVSSNAPIHVDPPRLTALTLNPETASLTIGESVTFSLTAHYSDNAIDNVTAAATWNIDHTDIAALSGSKVTALQEGETTLHATFETRETEASITVKPEGIVSVTIEGGSEVEVGHTLGLSALGHYADGRNEDVTASCIWNSSTPSAATVTGGIVTGIKKGQSIITANCNGLSAQQLVAVIEEVWQNHIVLGKSGDNWQADGDTVKAGGQRLFTLKNESGTDLLISSYYLRDKYGISSQSTSINQPLYAAASQTYDVKLNSDIVAPEIIFTLKEPQSGATQEVSTAWLP